MRTKTQAGSHTRDRGACSQGRCVPGTQVLAGSLPAAVARDLGTSVSCLEVVPILAGFRSELVPRLRTENERDDDGFVGRARFGGQVPRVVADVCSAQDGPAADMVVQLLSYQTTFESAM